MIQTSSGYLAAVNSTSREWSARLASSGTAINAEIMSVTVHKGTRGDELNVGTMYAPYFEATIRGYSGTSLLGSTLTFDLGLTVSGATEWATIATGTVISAKAQGNDLLGTTVTCRDGITSLTGTLATAMTGQTIRGALQSLAAFFGGYVTENSAGQIVIGGLSQTSTTAISPDTYQEEPELSTGAYEITGWRVFVDSETYYLDGMEPYLDTACQFMTQAQFNAVKAGVIGQIFRGGSIDQTLGNPLIEPWDVLTLSVSADAMPRLGAVTIIYDGGVSVRIESPVTTDDEQPAQVVGPLSGQVAEAAAAADSAKTSAEEALETAQEVNNHFYVDSAGLHVTLLESSPNTGQNILIDSYGLQVRDGVTPLASFENTGAQIGKTGETHAEIDYHSLQLIDREGNAYFFVSDLRDQHGELQMTETFEGGRFVYSLMIPASDTNYTVSVNGSVVTSGIAKTVTSFTFSTKPLDSDTVEVVYTTTSPRAKAFTFGTRSGTIGPTSVAEGYQSEASGSYSHAEGQSSVASGGVSHSEGSSTQATGYFSHAEGSYSIASGNISHAEGSGTTASTDNAHAEGDRTTASGISAHAEGQSTTASGTRSHAQNNNTVAGYADQTAIGKYNDNQSGNLFEIGNGTSSTARSNALSVSSSGILSTRNPSNTFGSIFDLIYPVGSIYMSVNNVDPGTLFGGTWDQIEDTFLLAAGTNHAAGSTGGSEDAVVPYHRHSVSITSGAGSAHSHGKGTLAGSTTNNMQAGASHYMTSATAVSSLRGTINSSSTSSYNYVRVANDGVNTGRGTPTIPAGQSVTVSGTTGSESSHTHSVSGNTGYAGTSGNATGANMPPFLAVYVWKRTA